MFKIIFLTTLSLHLIGCSTTYPNKKPLNQVFPSVKGKALTNKQHSLPNDMKGKPTLFLVGYVQDAQFDIDRWLIGLDQTKTEVAVYELPTIKGMFPRMFSTVIDNGMRKGIPKDLWKGVITIYNNSEEIYKFTGNEQPRNTRVILLDKDSKVVYFNDEGFSVRGLNELRLEIRKQVKIKK